MNDTYKHYIIKCFNEKNKIVYSIECYKKEKEFLEEIKSGYILFEDWFSKTICYLSQYNKVEILKGEQNE